MANTKYDSVFTRVVTCSGSNQKLPLETSKNVVSLISTGDCFINFDDAVTTTNRMLLKSGVPFYLDSVVVTQLNYMADTGTPLIYIMAVKSPSV